MQVWVVTTKEKGKVVGIYSDPAYAKKNIAHPENVKITRFQVNETILKKEPK